MSMDVETKDCTALSDAELTEMADMCSSGPAGFEIGLISKQRDLWVLVTQVRENGKLHGFGFCTLERIGGTPSLLIGLASIRRSAKRDTALRTMIADQLRRSLLAFPDEDVLVGTRMMDPSAFTAYKGLAEIVPSPGHKASGEERAWSRRLAKRFGAEHRVDDRAFIITGDGSPDGLLDFETVKPESISAEVAAFFANLNRANGDVVVAFGWAMAEELAARVAAGK
jgi:hypothetical protein